MVAYDEDYLSEAMCHIGEMLDYAVYDLKYDLQDFWEKFIRTDICKSFEGGHPKYVAGMSGVELAKDVVHELTGEYVSVTGTSSIDCSKEYWTGWVLAYYQNQKNITFLRMNEFGLTAEVVRSKYILHEADILKFVDCADELIENNKLQNETL